MPEPRSLSLRILSRLDDDASPRRREIHFSLHQAPHPAVTGGLPGGRLLGNGPIQVANLIGPSACEHLPGAFLDPRREDRAGVNDKIAGGMADRARRALS